MSKRILSTLLALCMALVLLPGGALAAETSGTCGENLKWALDSAGTLTISGTGEIEDYGDKGEVVPWYDHISKIKVVKIESGVTGIGQATFFDHGSLISVTISSSVTRIGLQPFSDCDNLTSIQVDPGNPAYTSIDGGLLTKAMDALIQCPGGKQGDYTIPEGVVRIEGCAFQGCSGLTSVTLPEGVTSIGGGAFRGCGGLTSLTIPVSLTSIESSAFEMPKSLPDVYYAGSEAQWQTIKIGSFNGCLTSATIHYNSAAAFPTPANPVSGSVFPDVADDAPYSEAAEYLNEVGIMQGDEKGRFSPDKTVTRAEMATLICRVLGETENLATANAFTDVPVSHWANKYIAKAASLGIIGGYGDGKFGPEDTVMYEQALAMIIRALGLSDEADKAGGFPDGVISVAENIGCIKQLSAKTGDLMVRWQIAIMIYNVVI